MNAGEVDILLPDFRQTESKVHISLQKYELPANCNGSAKSEVPACTDPLD